MLRYVGRSRIWEKPKVELEKPPNTVFYPLFSQWVIEATKNSDETTVYLACLQFAEADETIYQELNEADEEKLRYQAQCLWRD